MEYTKCVGFGERYSSEIQYFYLFHLSIQKQETRFLYVFDGEWRYV